MTQCGTHYIDLPLKSRKSRSVEKRCRKKGARWTRSGCLTCKRRRKRCDEAKPGCWECARLGLNCEGYGSMWATPLSPAAPVFQQTGASTRRRADSLPSISAYSEKSWESPSSPNSFPSPSTWPDMTSPPISGGGCPSTIDWNIIDDLHDNAETTVATTYFDSFAWMPDLCGYPSPWSTLETLYLQSQEQYSTLLENDEYPLQSLYRTA